MTATPAISSVGSSSTWAGTGDLVRLAWRRDRVLLPVWWLGLVALAVGSAVATRDLYPDESAAARDLAAIIDNPSVLALYGPLSATSIDALSVFKTVMMGAVFVSVLALVVVRRHTRAEEDDGRIDLVGSGAVARRAPLAAAAIMGTIAVVVPSMLSAVGLAAAGQDPWGSVAFGAAWLAPGLAMVGLAAVVVQVAGTSRSVSGLGYGLLGVWYLMRIVGDLGTGTAAGALGRLSPLGWTGDVSAYGANRVAVAGLGVAALGAGVTSAVWLLDRRDLGGGLIAPRLGPARAGRSLSGPLGLTLRLARGTIIGWSVAMVIGGALVASLISAVESLIENPAVASMLETIGGGAGSLAEIYLAAEIHIVAVAVAAAGLALALRLAGAEVAGFSELVLSAAAGRSAWFRAHAIVAFAFPVGLMAILGIVLGLLGRPLAGDSAPGFAASIAATLAAVPAAWVVVAAGLALVGLSVRLRLVAWVLLALWFVLGELGPSMGLPSWVVALSPFDHMSQLPGGSFNPGATAGLLLATAALLVLGAAAYQRRDVS